MPCLYNLSNPIDLGRISKPIYADTNVIVGMYYPNSGLVPNPKDQIYQAYHRFIRNMFLNDIKLHITTHVLMELENCFVKNDHRLYKIQHNIAKLDLKTYRHEPTEQAIRKQTYEQVFDQILENNKIVCGETEISCNIVQSFIASLDMQTMDPNDFILAEICKNKNAMILTNDKFFASPVVQCDLITNNQELIEQGLTFGFILANP